MILLTVINGNGVESDTIELFNPDIIARVKPYARVEFDSTGEASTVTVSVVYLRESPGLPVSVRVRESITAIDNLIQRSKSC